MRQFEALLVGGRCRTSAGRGRARVAPSVRGCGRGCWRSMAQRVDNARAESGFDFGHRVDEIRLHDPPTAACGTAASVAGVSPVASMCSNARCSCCCGESRFCRDRYGRSRASLRRRGNRRGRPATRTLRRRRGRCAAPAGGSAAGAGAGDRRSPSSCGSSCCFRPPFHQRREPGPSCAQDEEMMPRERGWAADARACWRCSARCSDQISSMPRTKRRGSHARPAGA